MLRKVSRLALSLVCFTILCAAASAQEFQKSYRLGEGATVSIQNVSGDVNITGYDGDSVVVQGFKEGRDRDRVDVEDLSGPNRVELRAHYPRRCNCDASIRFEVRVPRQARLNFDRISTASGNIKAEGIAGQIHLQTASGNVTVHDTGGEVNASTASGDVRVHDVSGTVSAQSASGNVEVEIARLEGSGNMKFSSASGNVNVRVPANLDAEVYLSTASGSLSTDFPLQVKSHEYGPGSSAEGQLGGGSRTLRITTASGDVSLKRL